MKYFKNSGGKIFQLNALAGYMDPDSAEHVTYIPLVCDHITAHWDHQIAIILYQLPGFRKKQVIHFFSYWNSINQILF